LSMALSRSAMNKVGDIGSPCLVPLLVANQLPSCPHTLTAAQAFSLMSLSNQTSKGVGKQNTFPTKNAVNDLYDATFC